MKAAFLNGELDEKLYMEQPQGYVVKGKEYCVYELRKALYGMKQASRMWRKVFNAFLESSGCVKSDADSSLYILKMDGSTVFILVYVDDLLLLAKGIKVLRDVAQVIANKFEVRIEHKVTRFLGMIIEQDPASNSIKLHSLIMIAQMLDRFGTAECKSASTPLPEGLVLSTTMAPVDEGEVEQMKRTPYRQLVGCLLHLANTTRPDLSFAAGYLSRFMSNPGLAHWKAAKHVMRYLKGSTKLGIVYGKTEYKEGAGFCGYCDSDFAGDVDNRKSTSWYCFIYAGGVVSWRSKKQQLSRSLRWKQNISH